MKIEALTPAETDLVRLVEDLRQKRVDEANAAAQQHFAQVAISHGIPFGTAFELRNQPDGTLAIAFEAPADGKVVGSIGRASTGRDESVEDLA